ncbi:rod shape-determining protein MreD [Desulfofustis limnaeus]|jgi:rod shape-determining protein MreD|uniref:Rod shape-determining protein MreD n=1 Tax=Desulfofustis limnaeus TaxID=2740163 RepID=A0ABM7W586_9BACT|nr:rod shape-determining protein MreD [Desulfofustis limnaeus]MDX9896287.1 rod shape-determining protein MreD [Desulfofustis sp.]BDD86086.1 hypothetical protein DPPLL_04510 [Desulfofustis limnaeus]
MRTVAFFLLSVGLLVLQTTVLQAGPSWFSVPDLVLVLVAFIAYRFPWLSGLFLCFAAGWMMDVLAGSFPGLFLFQYLFVFLVLLLVTQRSPIRESAYQVPLVGIVYFTVQCVSYFAMSAIDAEFLLPWSWGRLIRDTVVVMVATIPCFILFNSLYEYLMQRRTVARVLQRKSGNRFR